MRSNQINIFLYGAIRNIKHKQKSVRSFTTRNLKNAVYKNTKPYSPAIYLLLVKFAAKSQILIQFGRSNIALGGSGQLVEGRLSFEGLWKYSQPSNE